MGFLEFILSNPSAQQGQLEQVVQYVNLFWGVPSLIFIVSFAILEFSCSIFLEFLRIT